MEETKTTADTQPEHAHGTKESIKDFFLIAIVSLIIVFLVRAYIAQPFVVSGASMEPTFHTGEYLIVDQITYKFEKPQRGDVVIFRYPVLPSKFFIKRIVGLPGETIKIEGFNVYIKGPSEETFTQLEESYIEFKQDSYLETELDDGQYFVMGDNRVASLDSRIWGPLEESYIIGKALIRLFPVDKIDLQPGQFE